MSDCEVYTNYLNTYESYLDENIINYVASVLEEAEILSVDDLKENIGELVDSFFTGHQNDLNKLYDGLLELSLNDDAILNGGKIKDDGELTKLAAPIKANDIKLEASNVEEYFKFGEWNKNAMIVEKEEGDRPVDARLTRTRLTGGAEAEEATLAVCQQINKREQESKDILIEDFDLSFGAATLMKGVTVQLLYQHRYGFIGRNGLGKSTLLRAIANGALKVAGSPNILLVEQEVTGDETSAVQSVLQADAELMKLRKEEKTTTDDEELKRIHDRLIEIDAESAESRASKILNGLGFAADSHNNPTQSFSGGWRMRLALARALFAQPDLLLLDEPTNMLDLKAIIWLQNYLANCWQKTIVVVSHDRAFLNSVATDILYLSNQAVDVYSGNYDRFLLLKEERLLHQIKEYESQRDYRSHVQAFIDKFRYNAHRAALVQSRIKMLEKLPVLVAPVREEQVKFKFLEPSQALGTLLKLEEVYFKYAGDESYLLNDINLFLSLKSRLCFVGENGAGKTTLLKLLIGEELEPTKGYRTAHGALRVGYFTQHHVDQIELDLTPVEFLQKAYPSKTIEFIRHALGSFGISGETAVRTLGLLSGGQKSRVAFAKIAALQPHLLIFDEPTNHLDIETVDALTGAINAFEGGVILVSHDEKLIKNVCSEVWLVAKGKVVQMENGIEEYRQLLLSQLDK